MPRAQRKEEILRSELPPTLPLMALRSTIVYPLGTIAVQMGAPENLSIIRAFDEPGLIVGLFVAGGDHDENVDPETFVGRVGVAEGRFYTSGGDDSSAAVKFGAGVQYDLTKQVALRVQYERYHFFNAFDSKPNVGEYTAGVKFSF